MISRKYSARQRRSRRGLCPPVSQRQQPRNEVEKLAKEMAGSLGRMTDYDARRAWTGIWAQAVAKASENDLARIA